MGGEEGMRSKGEKERCEGGKEKMKIETVAEGRRKKGGQQERK